MNKFRNLCNTGIFYFFPKLLISISRKEHPWRLRAIDNFSLFYRLPRPDASAINAVPAAPNIKNSLTILAKSVEDDILDIRFLTVRIWINCQLSSESVM